MNYRLEEGGWIPLESMGLTTEDGRIALSVAPLSTQSSICRKVRSKAISTQSSCCYRF